LIIALERFTQVLDAEGRLTQRAAEYFEEITRAVNLNTPITGTGSPEGVVVGNPYQRYVNTAGASGSISYIKMTGDGDTGWVLE